MVPRDSLWNFIVSLAAELIPRAFAATLRGFEEDVERGSALWFGFVTIELARRLLHGGAPAASIEAALVAHALQGEGFVSALLERSPELSELVERELSRVPEGTLEVHLVRPSRELGELLPPGLCQRLLAVPLRRDAEGGVNVAAVDVFDPHVSQEFGFHLQAPVRLWRAELRAVAGGAGFASPSTCDGSRIAPAPPPVAPVEELVSSNPPLPCVRRAPAIRRSLLIRRPEPHPVFSLKRPRVHVSDDSFHFARTLDQALGGTLQRGLGGRRRRRDGERLRARGRAGAGRAPRYVRGARSGQLPSAGSKRRLASRRATVRCSTRR